MAETTQVQGMGSEGKVQLGNEMQEAMAACAAYMVVANKSIENVRLAYEELQKGFQGRAAHGFNTFYLEIVDKFFMKGGTFEKYMMMYGDEKEGLFANIEKTFILEPSGIDPNLAEQNTQMAGGDKSIQ